MASWELSQRRFRGRTLFLAAGLPSSQETEAGFDPVEATEEAVISLARAVFAEGGQIALIEDEVIALLVGMVAGEYLVPEPAETVGGEIERPPAEAPVRVYRPGGTEQDGEIDFLARHGYISVRNPEDAGLSLDSQMSFILADARPDALVCLGGGEETESQCRSFLRLAEGRRAYILGTTGGSASRLAESFSNLKSVRRIDLDVLAQLNEYAPVIHRILGEPEQEERESGTEPQPVFFPYPLIMQLLVEELIEPEETPGRPTPWEPETGPKSGLSGGKRFPQAFRSA